jgi:hypothetical protein
MSRIEGYGLRVFRNGVDFRSDRRWRVRVKMFGQIIDELYRPSGGYRGEIKAFSRASQRRLAFLFANMGTRFRSLVTLTYHALAESWEAEGDRNWRIVQRSKRDLNRFLTSMRSQLGPYVWVQEFQQRGVVHYHLACEGEVPEPEAKLVWCRSIDALDDSYARRYGAKVDAIRDEVQVRKYLGHYIGKARQKLLPKGVDGAGRWWGCSRSVEMVVFGEVIAGELKARALNEPEARTVRCLRKFLSRLVGFKFKGGVLIDWAGKTSERMKQALEELVGFYGRTESAEMLLEKLGWELTEVRDE